jgi:hypothetical protein
MVNKRKKSIENSSSLKIQNFTNLFTNIRVRHIIFFGVCIIFTNIIVKNIRKYSDTKIRNMIRRRKKQILNNFKQNYQ